MSVSWDNIQQQIFQHKHVYQISDYISSPEVTTWKGFQRQEDVSPTIKALIWEGRFGNGIKEGGGSHWITGDRGAHMFLNEAQTSGGHKSHLEKVTGSDSTGVCWISVRQWLAGRWYPRRCCLETHRAQTGRRFASATRCGRFLQGQHTVRTCQNPRRRRF